MPMEDRELTARIKYHSPYTLCISHFSTPDCSPPEVGPSGKEKEQGQILPPHLAGQRDLKQLQTPPGAGCDAGDDVSPVLRRWCHPLLWVLFELQDICDFFFVMLECTG